MNKTLTLSGHPVRPTVLFALLGLAGTTHADLKMTATVTGSGSQTSHTGIPVPGTYEIDFRSNLARIVKPNGSMVIFDFSASQVAFVNTTQKTYSVETIDKMLREGDKPTATATLSADTTAQSETMFGVSATKVTIGSQFSTTPLASNSGFGGGRSNLLNAMSAQRGSSSTSRSVSQQGSSSGSQGMPGNVTGSGWIADGSAQKSTISSVAPLVMIGAPRSLAYSLTETLNQKAGIPVALSFTWSGGKAGTENVAMTVTAINSTTLATTAFSVPSDYKLVTRQSN